MEIIGQTVDERVFRHLLVKSGDLREIISEMKIGYQRAKLAFDVFCYRLKKYIGAYAAAMGGVDAIVFTAGIGI